MAHPKFLAFVTFILFLKTIAMKLQIGQQDSDRDVNTAILYSILRNFKSQNLSQTDPADIFINALLPSGFVQNTVNPLDLLKDNIMHEDPDGTMPVRYPLVITREPHIVLTMLKQYQGLTDEMEIIYGAPFKDDHSYTSICRCIDKVKLCLESGKKVALINCGYIYESIYDAMNQYYQTWGGGKYVNLGLGTHRPPCRVDSKSRLVIFATLEEVKKEFPIPLINRLEKHEISSSLALQDDGKKIANDLMRFSQNFVCFQNPPQQQKKLKASDCFVGFNEDTCFSIVSKVIGNRMDSSGPESRLNAAKKLLLESASPDSVIRFEANARKTLCDYEFKDSIVEPTLRNFLDNSSDKFLQITTFSRLLTNLDMAYLEDELYRKGNDCDEFMLIDDLDPPGGSRNATRGFNPSSFKSPSIELVMLNAMQSESQLIDTLENKIVQSQSGGLVILQCSELISARSDRSASKNLIECTCFHIQNILNQDNIQAKVVFIIQLPLQSASAGFIIGQAAFCRCIHIDELIGSQGLVDATGNIMPSIRDLQQCGNISDCIKTFFLGKEVHLICRLFHTVIWQACSTIQDMDQNISRHSDRVIFLTKALEGNAVKDNLHSSDFLKNLLAATTMQQQKLEEIKTALGFAPGCWVSSVAKKFNMRGTFRNAVLNTLLSDLSLSFAKVISNWDRLDNLSLMAKFPAVWLALAMSFDFYDSSKSDAASDSANEERMAVLKSFATASVKPLTYDGQFLHFASNFPFFAHLFELLSNLWTKFNTSEDFLNSCKQIGLNSIIPNVANDKTKPTTSIKEGQIDEIERLEFCYCIDLVQLILCAEGAKTDGQQEFVGLMAKVINTNAHKESSKYKANIFFSDELSGGNNEYMDDENINDMVDCVQTSNEKICANSCQLAIVYVAHSIFMSNNHCLQQICRLYQQKRLLCARF
mmetsp:Transcript_36167/g.55256  ORF Transcript_36167/g.55256 Transcript_36167/m.55256 type:complete len:931 (+) Transcript_36167:1550-4342(+)